MEKDFAQVKEPVTSRPCENRLVDFRLQGVVPGVAIRRPMHVGDISELRERPQRLGHRRGEREPGVGRIAEPATMAIEELSAEPKQRADRPRCSG